MTNAVYVLAEVGSTHDGSVGIACNSVRVAASCGVNAVKFQTHIAAAETLKDAPPPPFFNAEPRFDYLTRTGFSEPAWVRIRQACGEAGVEFVSSPFALEAVELLERVGITRYKIPSGEITNTPLIEEAASTGKPMLISSGMSDWKELDRAVDAALKRNPNVTVLQCTSRYPTPYEDVGLNVMLEMRERYGMPVGLSDHTSSNYAAFAAVTMGASVVEKHFTLSRHLYGSDAAHSTEPPAFKDLVDGIRAIEIMRQSKVDKSDASRFAEMKRIFEKSIVAAVDIEPGTVISRNMLAFKKPGTGISPSALDSVIGATAVRRIVAERIISPADLEPRTN